MDASYPFFLRSRRVRWAVATAAALGVAAAAAAFVGACIPGLGVSALPDALPPPPSCGDGIVELDAGEQCDPGEAGALGCTGTCAVDCDGGLVDPTTSHCYFFPAGSNLNYVRASGVCDGQNAHVVTFVSRDELATVAAWNASKGNLPFWVGMRGETNGWIPPVGDEPGYSAACAGCFASTDVTGQFPQPLDAGSPCVQVASSSPSAPWQRVPCTNVKHTICEREPPGSLADTCNGGVCIVLRRTFGTKRYIYIATRSTDDEASRYCQQFPRGQIVMLDSREEREQLWVELGKIDDNIKQIWIGLARDPDAGDEWRWDDGAPLDGGRPIPWGVAQGIATDGAAPRAYLERQLLAVDSQLARNNEGSGLTTPQTLPFVCQFVSAPDSSL